MHTLVSRPPTTSIYCCEHGGIHLVYQNINIGMHPTEFCALNKHIQDAVRRINEGTWPCPYVSLKYSTTVVCLAIGALQPLAAAMAAAGAAASLDPGWSKAHYRLGCAVEGLAADEICAGEAGRSAAVDLLPQAHAAFEVTPHAAC